ncbi:Coilin [Bienertia sinuspersici]
MKEKTTRGFKGPFRTEIPLKKILAHSHLSGKKPQKPEKIQSSLSLSLSLLARVMETTKQRLRVYFQDTGILTKTQKKNGLRRSWVPLNPQFQTISDIISYILHSFDLHKSCPNGIILSMDGFVLPPFESVTILKDKDLIRVKRKGSGKFDIVKAIEVARPSIEDKIVEKKLLPSGVRLLAEEKFDEETRGYQIESLEDEDEAEEPVKSTPGGDVASKKRKASDNIESLKKKRRRQVVPESVQKKNVDHVKTPQKKRKLANGSKHEDTANCAKNSEPISNELEEKKEVAIHGSGVSNGSKKVCRSTRRKRLQRRWQKCAKANEDVNEKQLPVKDLSKELGSKNDLGKSTEQQAEEDSDADDDLVPVVIRPGHIRFGRSSKATDVGKNQEANERDVQSTQKCAWEDHSAQKDGWGANKDKVAKESFCWNGITNKRKGQKWGMENQPTSWKEPKHSNGYSSSSGGIRNQQTSSWKGPRDHNTHSFSTWASKKRQNNAFMDFEKLVPLIDLPKVGDVIAYRLLELSSTWCPELSSFRVGKIKCFDQESNKITVVPEPDYPLNLEKKADDDQDGDDSGQPPQPSVYNDDGSLEIDFPSLVDVRIVKRGDPSQSEASGVPAANGTSSVPSGLSKTRQETEDGSKNIASDAANQQPTSAAPENGKKDVWEEISDALTAKKAQLKQEDNWNKKQTSSKRSWSNRTLKSSALGPTMARLRAQNGV